MSLGSITGNRDSDQNQLVKAEPAQPSSTESDIAFANNFTPTTFASSSRSQSSLRPSSPHSRSRPNSPGPRRYHTHSRKKPSNHIPRPPNAFILFRSSFIKSQHVSTEVETNHSTLSKIIGMTWQGLPESERQFWHDQAKVALDEHRAKFPEYAFKPAPARRRRVTSDSSSGGKRKARAVGFKDTKRCAKIAELLVEGKTGADLDAAVQEFDKTHVPEIVTRFEDPLTAHSFKRRRRGADSSPVNEDDSESLNRTRQSSSSPVSTSSPPIQRSVSLNDLTAYPSSSGYYQDTHPYASARLDQNSFSATPSLYHTQEDAGPYPSHPQLTIDTSLSYLSIPYPTPTSNHSCNNSCSSSCSSTSSFYAGSPESMSPSDTSFSSPAPLSDPASPSSTAPGNYLYPPAEEVIPGCIPVGQPSGLDANVPIDQEASACNAQWFSPFPNDSTPAQEDIRHGDVQHAEYDPYAVMGNASGAPSESYHYSPFPANSMAMDGTGMQCSSEMAYMADPTPMPTPRTNHFLSSDVPPPVEPSCIPPIHVPSSPLQSIHQYDARMAQMCDSGSTVSVEGALIHRGVHTFETANTHGQVAIQVQQYYDEPGPYHACHHPAPPNFLSSQSAYTSQFPVSNSMYGQCFPQSYDTRSSYPYGTNPGEVPI